MMNPSAPHHILLLYMMLISFLDYMDILLAKENHVGNIVS